MTEVSEYTPVATPIPTKEVVDRPRQVKVFAHRAGWLGRRKKNGDIYDQNSLPQAAEALSIVDGVEIDIGFTKDGVAVVTHKNMSKKSFEEFKKGNPNHGTLEDWVSWYKDGPGMDQKEIYFDLKTTDQDPYKLIKLTEELGSRVSIGSKDPNTIFRLLLARDLLNSQAKIYLQIPDPAIPELAVEYANKLLDIVGVDSEDPDIKSRKSRLKPDGVHFYWPQNVGTDITAEIKGHGRYVSVLDKTKNPDVVRSPNIPIFHDLQRLRLKRFVTLAKKSGFEVVAGSVASSEVMERMIGWGVDAIMPNIPNESPILSDNQQRIEAPKDVHKNTTTILRSPAEAANNDNLDESEKIYNRLTQNLKKVSTLRQQFGL